MLIFEWLFKAVVIAVLGLLNFLGWKRAGKWLYGLVGDFDKDEKPVV